jgi:hypothetical protein
MAKALEQIFLFKLRKFYFNPWKLTAHILSTFGLNGNPHTLWGERGAEGLHVIIFPFKNRGGGP